jgi:glycerophosphoryl diester phosphodiesterase
MIFENIVRFIQLKNWPQSHFSLPKVQAHRGFWSAGFNQNTKESFRAAKAAGYKMSELDVRWTLDKKIVCFHDANLINYNGNTQNIDQCLFTDLVGPYKISTLEEVLNDASGTEFYNIEIKSEARLIGQFEKEIAKIVVKCGAEKRVMFSSFNPFSLVLISKVLPDIPCALLVTEKKEKSNYFVFRKMMFAPFLNIHALHLDDEMLRPDRVSLLKQNKIRYSVWTVNSEERACELLSKGAASIITDQIRPGLFY